jgi:KDO2-lipid IV(A) lauroyltransferase
MRIWIATLALRLLGRLPLAVFAALGGALGWLLYVVPNRRRRTAATNLALCFPEMNAAARERLLRRNLLEFARSFTEIAVLWGAGRERFCGLVRRSSGEELVPRALKGGKGVIVAAPHLGAWELGGIYCSTRYPFTALFRPLPDAPRGGLPCHARERFGGQMVPTDASGVRALFKALERNEMVWILPDQVPASRGSSVFAPFFGRPASTMVLLSRLAIKTGAPVVFCYAERLSRGRGYHLHFLPAPEAINHGSVEESAAVVNSMVERCVRALPVQYLWAYKRFRVAPPGGKPPY